MNIFLMCGDSASSVGEPFTFQYATGGGTAAVLVDTAGCTVDWGDGTGEHTLTPGTVAYGTMPAPGPYIGSVLGASSTLSVYGNQLEKILSWGTDVKQSIVLGGALASVALDTVPDTLPSYVTSLYNMFGGCSAFNQDISGWDTSNVVNMSYTFNSSAFNKNISNWNTHNVTSMTGMFYGASVFNQDLSGWCVENILAEPTDFKTGATAWTLPKPVWGSCP